MEIDVALVPQVALLGDPAVFIVVDEIRASTTSTTLLDLGCLDIYIESALVAARRLGLQTGSILVGERHGLLPAGFDVNTSPSRLVRADIQGRRRSSRRPTAPPSCACSATRSPCSWAVCGMPQRAEKRR